MVGDLARTTDGATYFAKKISGAGQRYDLPGNHRLVGRSAPDYELADGSRLADHLHDARALLIDPSGALRDIANGYGDRLRGVTMAPLDGEAPAALFVRPDGFVAWAGEPDPGAVEETLVTWLGTPLKRPA